MAIFTAESAGFNGMKEYSIILNSFQPQNNSFASKTGILAGATVISRLVLITTLYIYVFELFKWVLYNNCVS